MGGTDFGEIRVELADVDVYLGGDDSRQANKLDYDVTTIALKGEYDLGKHNLTFGIEREALEVSSLFVQHSETEIRFDGIENFRNGFAEDIYYKNGNPNVWLSNNSATKSGFSAGLVPVEYQFRQQRAAIRPARSLLLLHR